MSESSSLFFDTFTQNADGTANIVSSNNTTTAKRSLALFAPAYSTLAIHVSGTATVVIKTNPFGETAKDFTIKTVTATTQEVITSANWYVIDVTAVSGTVTAVLVCNED